MSRRRNETDPGSMDSMNLIAQEEEPIDNDTFDDRQLNQSDMRLNKSDFGSTRQSVPNVPPPIQTREPNLTFGTTNMVSPISPMTMRHADADINIKVG